MGVPPPPLGRYYNSAGNFNRIPPFLTKGQKHPPLTMGHSAKTGRKIQVKYPACAGYEIITFGHCKIFCLAESEMKFAHIREANISHLQKQIFYSEVISLARRANFVAPNKKRQAKPVFFYLVRMMGLEPTRCCHHWNLNPARLPIPPHPH